MPKEYYEKMWKAIREEAMPFVSQVKNKRKNKEIYWQELHISPVLNAPDEPEFYIGIEPKIPNPEIFNLVESTMSQASDGTHIPVSIVPIGWILSWLYIYEVISKETEEILTEIYGRNASGATLMRDFISQ
ncbi:MAG: hypothetical protein O3C23_01870 [bacterium]|nr:hypothetical protein [bacterium]